MSKNNFWDDFWKALAIYGISLTVDYFANEIKKYVIKEIA